MVKTRCENGTGKQQQQELILFIFYDHFLGKLRHIIDYYYDTISFFIPPGNWLLTSLLS